MNTLYLNPKKDLEKAAKIIKDGGLTAFPTETVYGLGGDALRAESAKKIYAAKGRPSDNPLIVHIAELKDLEKIAIHISDIAYEYAKKFWPGPLTMIFKKKTIIPPQTTGGLDTVAVRMPSQKTALLLIKAAGGFIAAPSANLSGHPSPTTYQHVANDLDGRIEAIICGEDCEIGLESTIVDMTKKIPVILRPGSISAKELDLEENLLNYRANQDVAPAAPGMKYTHYAPKGNLYIVRGEKREFNQKLKNFITADKIKAKSVGVIAANGFFKMDGADIYVIELGDRANFEETAHHLYSALRSMDDLGVDVIYSMDFTGYSGGYAIMDRLNKAAGFKFL